MSRAVNRIVYGQWTFSGRQVKDGNVYLATSLLSDSLEANTLEVTVECPDKSILDFQRNAPLTYFRGAWKIGIFYVQSITRIGPMDYTIQATSAIGLLIESRHYGGVYSGQTVAEIVKDICGSIPYAIKTDLREIALYGWLPVASRRDNLAQVLLAVGATVKTDLDGVLRIENLWDQISAAVSRDELYSGADVDYGAKVTAVVVTEHQYSEGGEETSLFEGTAQDGDVVTFSEPMYDLQATGLQIVESGANYAVLSAGTGTLTGRKYIHRTRQITEPVSQAGEANIKTVEDATLVSVTNSRAVAQRLAEYYKTTETINADMVYEREAPGDVVQTWHPYDQQVVSACLESVDITMSGTLKGTAKLRVGYIPPKDDETVIYDHKEILTGSGSWTPPEGTTSVHAVLIGGGGLGNPGAAGGGQVSPGSSTSDEDSKRVGTGITSATASASTTATSEAVSAGKGGEGGQPGVPGYVLETDLSVTPGQPITYSCGAAGAVAGQTGGNTTFGPLQSNNGGVLEGGYIDVTDGTVYGAPGETGVAGGDGGAANQPGSEVAGVQGGNGLENNSDSHRFNGTTPHPDFNLTGNISDSWSYGGFGGGGAGGGTEDNPGSPGGNAEQKTEGSFTTPDGVSAAAYGPQVDPGPGGAGAPGKNAATYGSAGSGGHGGGGAGAIGNRSSSASGSFTVTLTADEWETINSIASYVEAETQPSNGVGGPGGAGGQGMAGCIILFYGVQQAVQSGALMDKNGKIFLDKFERFFVI